jgi:hypothetical protein
VLRWRVDGSDGRAERRARAIILGAADDGRADIFAAGGFSTEFFFSGPLGDEGAIVVGSEKRDRIRSWRGKPEDLNCRNDVS